MICQVLLYVTPTRPSHHDALKKALCLFQIDRMIQKITTTTKPKSKPSTNQQQRKAIGPGHTSGTNPPKPSPVSSSAPLVETFALSLAFSFLTDNSVSAIALEPALELSLKAAFLSSPYSKHKPIYGLTLPLLWAACLHSSWAIELVHLSLVSGEAACKVYASRARRRRNHSSKQSPLSPMFSVSPMSAV